ncbi:unnamed protein product [Paramecium pentaurelia]|uniref:WD40-repeat-containing domain n=1 Tax=Paramecium pentaurelia TaxID=43138 RepID=A0A8S1XTF4_9CILI|nr:unnamed protein product [Paramecium pentaurelia]
MNSGEIIGKYQNKVEECLQGVQQYLDCSYDKIDSYLDQLLLDPYPYVPIKNLNLALPVIQLFQPSIQPLINQLIEEVKPIINLTFYKQIKQQQENLDCLQQQLIQQQTKQIQQQNQIIQDNHHQSNLKRFNYNLIQKYYIQQWEYCYAIAINQDNSIVLAGCDSKIKIFEFKQEQLIQIQLLSDHQSNVTTLNFMKKSNQFISGSSDNSIIIWSMDQHNQWICSQKLNEHKDLINCLLLNNNEDIIISGSNDKSIKFWIKQNEWICSQTITDHTDDVLGLSLNEKQNRVISCDKDKLILIIEQSSQDQKWSIIQQIIVDEWGLRLCFIIDNLFIFQPYHQEKMHVYELNNNNKQYSKTKEIAVKCGNNSCYYWFPQQYIKSKCLFVNKNGQNVNLIRKNQNGDFITQQSIEFKHYYIFGQMSENGEYLITWDYDSKAIQIRKYDEE